MNKKALAALITTLAFGPVSVARAEDKPAAETPAKSEKKGKGKANAKGDAKGDDVRPTKPLPPPPT